MRINFLLALLSSVLYFKQQQTNVTKELYSKTWMKIQKQNTVCKKMWVLFHNIPFQLSF